MLQLPLGMDRRDSADRPVGPERVRRQETPELYWVFGRSQLGRGGIALQLEVI
jgi:hypothetical protein